MSQLESELQNKCHMTPGVPGWMMLSKLGWVHGAAVGSGVQFKGTNECINTDHGGINAPGHLHIWPAVSWMSVMSITLKVMWMYADVLLCRGFLEKPDMDLFFALFLSGVL